MSSRARRARSYYLLPGSTATFTFTGRISLDNTTSISPVPGEFYSVVVSGPDGTYAVGRVEATGG